MLKKTISLLIMTFVLFGGAITAQTPVIYKEVKVDTEKCLQINNFNVVRSIEEFNELPQKYNANCENINIPKINFDKNILIGLSQYVRNGKKGIKSTRIEVLRNDASRRIDIFFATFASSDINRAGRVHEHRKWLLVPQFPKNYKVDVRYSLNVVE
jgi:hypothetical protein